MIKTVYFPDDAKTKEVFKRVEVYQKKRGEAYGKDPSFSEIVVEALTALVSVKGTKTKRG